MKDQTPEQKIPEPKEEWANIRIKKVTAVKIKQLRKKYSETHAKPTLWSFVEFVFDNYKL